MNNMRQAAPPRARAPPESRDLEMVTAGMVALGAGLPGGAHDLAIGE